MKVILTSKVESLGNVGEIVKVAPGHARNYLLPRKLALLADERNTKVLENHKKRLQKIIDEEKKIALSLKKQLEKVSLVLEKRVGGNGKLFGAITTKDLSALLLEKGLEVEKRLLSLDRPIKQVGEFTVLAKLFKEVEAEFKVKVVIEPKQLEEMKAKQAEKEKEKKNAAKKQEEAQNEEASLEAENSEAAESADETKESN